MSNANTCLGGYAGNGTTKNLFPVTQAVATATETALVINTNTGTATALVTVPSGGKILGSSTPFSINANDAILGRSGREYGQPNGETNDQFSSASWDGVQFRIRLSGVASLGATQTAIFYLYNGAATVVGTSGNRIALTGAAYPSGGTSTTPSNFVIEFTGLWDPTSQVLSGCYTSNIANGTTSQFTTTTVITNVQTSVTAAGLTFCAGIKLANATASTVSVREFLVEKL
jgi:hypothetical protein